MFKSSGKKAVEQLIKHVDLLSQKSADIQKDLVTKYLADAQENVDHNEWGLAIEMLLENIYEIDFKIDLTTIELTKTAFKECEMDYSQFAFIEKLVK